MAGLAHDALSSSPIVLLRDPSGLRQVPIWIDQAQARSIMAGCQNNNPNNPLSHDLIVSLIKETRVELDRVLIHSIEENTFQAILKLKRMDKTLGGNPSTANSFFEIIARPSDAIALAVRTKSSIWMCEEVLAEASIPVDMDADEEDQDNFKKFIEMTTPAEIIQHLRTKDKDY